MVISVEGITKQLTSQKTKSQEEISNVNTHLLSIPVQTHLRLSSDFPVLKSFDKKGAKEALPKFIALLEAAKTSPNEIGMEHVVHILGMSHDAEMLVKLFNHLDKHKHFQDITLIDRLLDELTTLIEKNPESLSIENLKVSRDALDTIKLHNRAAETIKQNTVPTLVRTSMSALQLLILREIYLRENRKNNQLANKLIERAEAEFIESGPDYSKIYTSSFVSIASTEFMKEGIPGAIQGPATGKFNSIAHDGKVNLQKTRSSVKTKELKTQASQEIPRVMIEVASVEDERKLTAPVELAHLGKFGQEINKDMVKNIDHFSNQIPQHLKTMEELGYFIYYNVYLKESIRSFIFNETTIKTIEANFKDSLKAALTKEKEDLDSTLTKAFKSLGQKPINIISEIDNIIETFDFLKSYTSNYKYETSVELNIKKKEIESFVNQLNIAIEQLREGQSKTQLQNILNDLLITCQKYNYEFTVKKIKNWLEKVNRSLEYQAATYFGAPQVKTKLEKLRRESQKELEQIDNILLLLACKTVRKEYLRPFKKALSKCIKKFSEGTSNLLSVLDEVLNPCKEANKETNGEFRILEDRLTNLVPFIKAKDELSQEISGELAKLRDTTSLENPDLQKIFDTLFNLCAKTEGENSDLKILQPWLNQAAVSLKTTKIKKQLTSLHDVISHKNPNLVDVIDILLRLSTKIDGQSNEFKTLKIRLEKLKTLLGTSEIQQELQKLHDAVSKEIEYLDSRSLSKKSEPKTAIPQFNQQFCDFLNPVKTNLIGPVLREFLTDENLKTFTNGLENIINTHSIEELGEVMTRLYDGNLDKLSAEFASIKALQPLMNKLRQLLPDKTKFQLALMSALVPNKTLGGDGFDLFGEHVGGFKELFADNSLFQAHELPSLIQAYAKLANRELTNQVHAFFLSKEKKLKEVPELKATFDSFFGSANSSFVKHLEKICSNPRFLVSIGGELRNYLKIKISEFFDKEIAVLKKGAKKKLTDSFDKTITTVKKQIEKILDDTITKYQNDLVCITSGLSDMLESLNPKESFYKQSKEFHKVFHDLITEPSIRSMFSPSVTPIISFSLAYYYFDIVKRLDIEIFKKIIIAIMTNPTEEASKYFGSGFTAPLTEESGSDFLTKLNNRMNLHGRIHTFSDPHLLQHISKYGYLKPFIDQLQNIFPEQVDTNQAIPFVFALMGAFCIQLIDFRKIYFPAKKQSTLNPNITESQVDQKVFSDKIDLLLEKLRENYIIQELAMALFLAIEINDPEKVKKVIETAKEKGKFEFLLFENRSGKTPLGYALALDNAAVVKPILEYFLENINNLSDFFDDQNALLAFFNESLKYLNRKNKIIVELIYPERRLHKIGFITDAVVLAIEANDEKIVKSFLDNYETQLVTEKLALFLFTALKHMRVNIVKNILTKARIKREIGILIQQDQDDQNPLGLALSLNNEDLILLILEFFAEHATQFEPLLTKESPTKDQYPKTLDFFTKALKSLNSANKAVVSMIYRETRFQNIGYVSNALFLAIDADDGKTVKTLLETRGIALLKAINENSIPAFSYASAAKKMIVVQVMADYIIAQFTDTMTDDKTKEQLVGIVKDCIFYPTVMEILKKEKTKFVRTLSKPITKLTQTLNIFKRATKDSNSSSSNTDENSNYASFWQRVFRQGEPKGDSNSSEEFSSESFDSGKAESSTSNLRPKFLKVLSNPQAKAIEKDLDLLFAEENIQTTYTLCREFLMSAFTDRSVQKETPIEFIIPRRKLNFDVTNLIKILKMMSEKNPQTFKVLVVHIKHYHQSFSYRSNYQETCSNIYEQLLKSDTDYIYKKLFLNMLLSVDPIDDQNVRNLLKDTKSKADLTEIANIYIDKILNLNKKEDKQRNKNEIRDLNAIRDKLILILQNIELQDKEFFANNLKNAGSQASELMRKTTEKEEKEEADESSDSDSESAYTMRAS